MFRTDPPIASNAMASSRLWASQPAGETHIAMVGLRSIGYLPGRPLDAGFYGQLGVVVSP